MVRPKVFISYSHDSDALRDEVLKLSDRLRGGGVETVLDRYVNGSPEEGWPRWMLNGLDSATHVICVCTETYYRRFRGHGAPGVGRGVDWEGAIITLDLYNARSRNSKFIPVVVDERAQPHIPEPLRGASFYRISEDYEALYDAILGQAGVEPRPLGELRVKPRTGTRATDSHVPAEASFNPPIEPTPEELASVFTETIAAIECILNSAPAVAKFLGAQVPATGRFAVQQAGQWAVLPTYRSGGADVGPVLESIWKRLSGLAASRHEWDALEQLVGGILVLGMNPRWIWDNRCVSATAAAVPHPKHAGEVSIEDGNAHFLALIATALANGCARLERVFGPLDRKQVPINPGAMPGITAADRTAETKRHLIRFVLGPRDDLDVDALSGEALDIYFRRVRQLLRIANRVDRDPFFLTDGPRSSLSAAEVKLAEEVKQHLELSDLYLFVPEDSGDESKLMKDAASALTLAQRIRNFIHARRPNI